MNRTAIAIRADASVESGTGHVRRCLTLAAALRKQGGDCVLVTRDLGLDVAPLADAAGVAVTILQAPRGAFRPRPGDTAHAGWARVDWEVDAGETVAAIAADRPAFLLADHYSFDARWHQSVRAGLNCALGAIDDLGDRPLAVDLIVDPTLAADHRAKHERSERFAPILLCGPSHALLAPAYRRRIPFRVRPQVESVGIFMGGSDIGNASSTAWQAVRAALGADVAIEIATTGANPHLDTLWALVEADADTSLLVDAPDLAAFFARHDLQVGAGGGATWERCCIGAPTVLVAFVENQLPMARPLHEAGIVLFCEKGENDVAALAQDVARLAGDQQLRAAMSARSRTLVDGLGVERVGEAILDLARRPRSVVLRDATERDAEAAHGWRDAESTRRYFRNAAPVAYADHLRWWQEALATPSRRLWIAETQGSGIGVIRLDLAEGIAEVSIYVDPSCAGRGLGTEILRTAAARGREMGLKGLCAEIDPANIASQHAFARAGFSRLDERNWSLRLSS